MACPMIMMTPPFGCSTIGTAVTGLSRGGPCRQVDESWSRTSTELRAALILLERKLSMKSFEQTNSLLNYHLLVLGQWHAINGQQLSQGKLVFKPIN